MWGCEHVPGHKAAAEEDASALPFEAGHGNGQHGARSLLTARRRLCPAKPSPLPAPHPGTANRAPRGSDSSAGPPSHGGNPA